jgi:hypothetical protein
MTLAEKIVEKERRVRVRMARTRIGKVFPWKDHGNCKEKMVRRMLGKTEKDQ